MVESKTQHFEQVQNNICYIPDDNQITLSPSPSLPPAGSCAH